MLQRAKNVFVRRLSRFGKDSRGNIAIVFALSSTMIVVGLGASVDLARAYVARQKLSQVAELTCQYSVRSSVLQLASNGTTGFATYVSTVNTFASQALANQHWAGTVPTAPSGTYFTATNSTQPTNPVVELSSAVPTYFMQIVKVSQITVHAKVACLTESTAPAIVTTTSSAGSYVAREGFESAACSSFCWVAPNGSSGTQSTPTSTTPSSPSYTGNYGQQWYILGYCLEIDATGVINATSPEGSHTVELDCDNGSGTAGNSSITTKVYLASGHYELRYNYRARVDYPNYDPAYICGTTAADISWANDTNDVSVDNGTAYRTNQINVYLDTASTSTIPLHATLDGTQKLGGTNLIDTCIYAPAWVQRSIKITVTTPAYYWLSFAADGQNDSYGAQLDNIQLCQEACKGTLTDNFPSSWLAANNGGTNVTLFEDSFESPAHVAWFPPYSTLSGTLGSSDGTTVSTGCAYGTTTSSYPSPPGWPCQQATGWTTESYVSGWSTAPYNQITYYSNGAAKGSQYIQLDGTNSYSSGSLSRNRLISRPFLLDPGYYQVSYNYIAGVNFASSGITGVYCTAAPASGDIYDSSLSSTYYTGAVRYGGSASYAVTTNIVGVFMSNGLLVSTPNPVTTLGATTTYLNTDNTVTTTPKTPPDNVNWSSYNAAVNNPVIDTCGYVSGSTWTARSVSVLITKPGLYWLTFSANGGAADGNGPGIDDVKLTALGSPYMSNPPTSALTTIPVPAPQNDTIYYGLGGDFSGFYIVADPLTPPAADQ